jgi:hypothetical protein
MPWCNSWSRRTAGRPATKTTISKNGPVREPFFFFRFSRACTNRRTRHIVQASVDVDAKEKTFCFGATFPSMARINSGNEKASTYDDRTVPIFGTRPTDDTAVFEYMSLNHHPDAPGLLSWGLLVKRLWPEQARLDHNEKKSCLRPENMPFVNEKRSMEYGSFFPTPAATISLPSVLLLFPQVFIRYLAP